MQNKGFDLASILSKYLKNWKWFLVSSIITITCAFFYLRYTVPEYSATAKIQILEDKGASSELSVLKDLDIFSAAQNQIIDEIEILSSRGNFEQVVHNLGLNIRYIKLGNLRNSEIYGEKYPFNINFLAPDSIINISKHQFYIDFQKDTSFGYSEEENAASKKYTFGASIPTKIGKIILTPNEEVIKLYKNQRIKVVIDPVVNMASKYREKTRVTSINPVSNILNVSLTDPILQKAIDIIDELIMVNNVNAVTDKKNIADRTSEFINDRITEIYSNLSSVDESAETFKSRRGIASDLGVQSSDNFRQSLESERKLQNTNIQLNIASSMQNLLSDQSGYDIIPSNIGLSDRDIGVAAGRYNELVAQRNRLLKSSNEKNPVIVQLDQELESLKIGMQSSLNNITNNLNLEVNSLGKQLSQINSRIYAAPGNERALRDITREQQTKESLYLYLLQKREESQVAYASASPKSKVVNSAYPKSLLPVSPKTKFVYLAALLVGLLIPFSVIYCYDLFDNKVHNKIELEKIIGDIPVLGEVPRLAKKDEKLVQNEDRTVLAESLRILRTNLDYIIKSSKKKSGKNNVIFVTSTVSGEGKTFISSNLAMIFANTGKKVLLIGADIRNPKLYTFFGNSSAADYLGKPKRGNSLGLTDYLFDSTLPTKEIVHPTLVNSKTVDVVYSGRIPPNPAELLMNDRMKDLFDEVSETYDYVIVDTAPLMVVTDTLLISQYSDHILYVTKADFTNKNVLDFPLKLQKEAKLKNLSFVVNNVRQSNLGYGGKYGYGYGKTVKKWWSFS